MALDRRLFIKAGLGGVLSPLLGERLAHGQAAVAPYILKIYVSGGWDTTMVFDPKLDSSFVTRESGVSIATGAGGLRYVHHPDRPSVRKFFNRYGASSAIVNGINAGSMDRLGALRNIWGTTPPNKPRPVDWLSFFVSMVNPVMDIPHAVIDAPYMPGDYSATAIRLTADLITDYSETSEDDELGASGETALANFRANAFGEALKTAHPQSLDGEKLRALYNGFAREAAIKRRLRTATKAIASSASDPDFIRHGKLAVELFARGATQCATIQAGRTGLWESPVDHFAAQSVRFEELFSGLNAIMEYANTRGIRDRLLLLVVSERGRAPRVNAAGGKGPWPITSMLLSGPGIAGGTVISASDAALRGMPINPVFGGTRGDGDTVLTMAHVYAALYLRFGVPYQLLLPGIRPLAKLISSQS